MKWVRHVAHMGRSMKMQKKFWSDKVKARDFFEDLGIDGRIILKCTLKK
jgi:hypothetical protein